MSLIISVWVPDPTAYAGRGSVPQPPGISDGVGPESFRYKMWGSAAARDIGATLLPELAHITEENRGNLDIPPGRLDAFDQECALLTANIEELAAATGYDTDRLLHYLSNMRSAVERARAVNGGVIVW